MPWLCAPVYNFVRGKSTPSHFIVTVEVAWVSLKRLRRGWDPCCESGTSDADEHVLATRSETISASCVIGFQKQC